MSYKEAIEAVMQEAEEAISTATFAGFSGSEYKVEIFEDGTFRLLWDRQIGNEYASSGLLVPVPPLNHNEMGDDETETIFDEAIAALREFLEDAVAAVAAE